MLFRLVCLIVLFPSFIAGASVQQNGRIIGGIPVDISDYPYQVSLDLDGGHICGGVIVSEYFIISAGHCIDGFDDKNITIRVNSSLLEEGGSVRLVKKRHLHPQYNPYDYDISVLELEESLIFGDGVRAIRLPESGERLENRTLLTISGWGAMDEDDMTQSPQLLAVNVSSYTNEECKAIYEAIDFFIAVTDRMICGNVPEGGHNSCNGDSGGPVVTRDGVVQGLVSWAQGCAEAKYPTVYTRVANPSLREFVRNITGL